MKRAFVILALGILSTGIFAQTSKQYSLEYFDKLSVEKPFDVEIVPSDTPSVTIRVDDKYLDQVVVRQTGEMVEIGIKGTVNNIKVMEAVICMPEIHLLKLSGCAKVKAGGGTLKVKDAEMRISGASKLTDIAFEGDKIEMEISGASKIKCKADVYDLELNVSGASDAEISVENTNKIDAEVSGASKAKLTGGCEEFDLKVAGASSVSAENLQAEEVEAKLSGASSAKVMPEENLKVEISGASTLRYKDTPGLRLKVESVTGASSLKKL